MAVIFSPLELFPFYSSSIGSGDIWPWQPFTELLKGPLGTLGQGTWANPVPHQGM